MNIKPIIARLQSSIERDDLWEPMLLLPGTKQHISEEVESANTFTLMVGYNGSSSSHAALDIALLIAHQTRLATSKQVTVKVVYVIDENQSSDRLDELVSFSEMIEFHALSGSPSKSATLVLAEPKRNAIGTVETSDVKSTIPKNNCFEKADRILWQARCLVEEWRDSFIAHLRIGNFGDEIRTVVELEAADLLVIGCQSKQDPIVRELSTNFPCAVLGIPNSRN